MGFKIKLASGKYYANRSGRVQYYETTADARNKINRKHLKGARIVHVVKSNRIPNKKLKVVRKNKTKRSGNGRKGKKGKKGKKVKKVKRGKKGNGKKGRKGKKGKKTHRVKRHIHNHMPTSAWDFTNF
jgi:hypothetical protein